MNGVKEVTCQRVTTEQAAKELGCSKSFLREQMRAGEWDLGYYGNRRKAGKKKDQFFIFRKKLDKLLEDME